MHLMEGDPLSQVRALRARFRRGELSRADYLSEFDRINSAGSRDLNCARGDGRRAVVIERGTPLCEACYLAARRA